jgi:gliding motility-associated-like protein
MEKFIILMATLILCVKAVKKLFHESLLGLLLAIMPVAVFAQYQVNGSANQTSCNCFEVTPDAGGQSGSVWNVNQINLNSPFTFTFDVFLGCNDGGADGMAFVLQPLSVNAGSSGGGLGYQNIAPSLAIEMDTYQNNTDPSYDHMALQVNGVVTHGTGSTLAGPIQTSATSSNVEDCAWHSLQVSWNPTTQTFTVSFDGVVRMTYSGNILAAFGGTPQAYWGFTAATGGASNQHQFCNTLNPSFNISSTTQCAGNPITFNSTSVVSTGQITGFAWDFGDGGAGTGTNPSHTYTSAGNYTATLSITSEGCVEVFSTPVTINPKPTADAGGDVPICLGNVVFMTPNNINPALAYSWFPTNGVSNANIPDPIITTPNTASYIMTVTDANGCQASDDVTIIVNPLPVAIAGVSQTICEGDVANLNGWGAQTLLWSPATGLSDVNIGTPTASPTATTNYTLLVTDANGCQDSDQITITVNPLPSVNAGLDAAICSGETYQMIGSGAVNYSWNPAIGLDDATAPNAIFSGSASSSFVLTGTDANGCENTASMMMTVNQLPPVNAGADVAICIGDVAQLNASGALNYVWSPSTDLDAPNIANPIFSGLATSVLTVIGTDVNGCINSDQITITVNPLPIVHAGPDAGVCDGLTLQLAASGASTYVWNPAIDLSNSTIGNPIFSGTVDATLTVIGTDINGCVNSDDIDIIVNALPIVNAGIDGEICDQETFQLSATGAISYAWTPSVDLDDATSANPELTGSSTTILTVTGTDANGCVNSDQVEIVVNPLPQAIIDVVSDVCLGAPTFFSESSIGNGLTYAWTIGENTNNTNSSFSHTYGSATTFPVSLEVTDVNGCQGSTATTAVVSPLPVVNMTIANGPDFCEGEPINFQNTSPGISAGVSWNFTYQQGLPPSPGSSSAQSNPVYAYPNYGTYNVRLLILSDLGCINSITRTVNIHDVPIVDFDFSVVCEGDATVFTDLSTVQGSSAISGWQWDYTNGEPFEYSQNPVYSYPQAGSYNVELISQTNQGCRDTIMQNVWVNPTPVISILATDVCVGFETQFQNFSTPQDATVLSWTWDFDDTQSATGSSATHTYSNYGSYSVSLTASTDSGCVSSGNILTQVFPNPEPVFLVTEAQGCEPHTTSFFNNSVIASGGIATYMWDFGLGQTVMESNPTVVYADTVGSFDVTLTAISTEGCQAIVTQTNAVTVNVTPEAHFTQSDDVIAIDRPLVQFTDASVDALSYQWNFGDGATSSDTSPSNSYVDPGIYTITLTVENGNCSDFTESILKVDPIFSFYIPSGFTPDNNRKNEVFSGLGEGYTDYQMMIYNRWGELLFYSGDDQLGWDGTHNGQECPAGVYIYQFLLRDWFDRERSYEGGVTLVR